KDSFREAVDAKVMYVMVGLSALLILVTVSLSFKPASVRDFMESSTMALNTASFTLGEGGDRRGRSRTIENMPIFFTLDSVEATSQESDEADRTYRVTIHARSATPEAADKVRES